MANLDIFHLKPTKTSAGYGYFKHMKNLFFKLISGFDPSGKIILKIQKLFFLFNWSS